MVDGAHYDSLKAWVASRPECVRKLYEEFPLRSSLFVIGGVRHYLLGYTESDELILTPFSPAKQWEKAQENKIYVCAGHFREPK